MRWVLMMGMLGWPLMLPAIQALEDLTPDAITGATGYSPRTGHPSVLVDGKYPGPTDTAGVFTWIRGGTLTFAFEHTVKVREVRLAVGEYASTYVLTVERLDEAAAGAGTAGSVIDSSGRVDDWLILRLPEPWATRSLRLSAHAKASLYEVQILGSRTIHPISLGRLKASFPVAPSATGLVR
jgi:hypothetical protein